MINAGSLKRDLLLLGSLIFMIKIAVDRQHREVVPPVLYAPAKQAVAMKAPMPIRDIKPVVQEAVPALKVHPTPEESPASFVVHEANADIVQHMETAQAHINQLLAIIKPATKHAAQLKSMQQRLTQLKKEYKNTSPAIALLGPIGTAGIVLKENELEKNLLRMINMTRSIAYAVANINEEKPSYKTISQGLEQNALLIASLNKENVHA